MQGLEHLTLSGVLNSFDRDKNKPAHTLQLMGSSAGLWHGTASLSSFQWTLTAESSLAQTPSGSVFSLLDSAEKRTLPHLFHQRLEPAGTTWGQGEEKRETPFGWLAKEQASKAKCQAQHSPVGSFFAVGEAQHSAEFHSQQKMQKEERLGAQVAGHVILLQETRTNSCCPQCSAFPWQDQRH